MLIHLTDERGRGNVAAAGASKQATGKRARQPTRAYIWWDNDGLLTIITTQNFANAIGFSSYTFFVTSVAWSVVWLIVWSEFFDVATKRLVLWCFEWKRKPRNWAETSSTMHNGALNTQNSTICILYTTHFGRLSLLNGSEHNLKKWQCFETSWKKNLLSIGCSTLLLHSFFPLGRFAFPSYLQAIIVNFSR